MDRDIQEAINLLQRTADAVQEEITPLLRKKARLLETLAHLKELAGPIPTTGGYFTEKRVRVTEMGVQSQTDSAQFYVIECYMIHGGALVGGIRDYLVLTCSCPAFKFSEGDQWSGQRKWCKHIRDHFYEVTNRSAVARRMERENLPIIGGGIPSPGAAAAYKPVPRGGRLTNRSR